MRQWMFWVALCSGTAVVLGCGSQPPSRPSTGSEQKPAAGAGEASVAPHVLATYRGGQVTIKDVKEFQQMVHASEKVDTVEQAVEELIARRLQLAQASRLGLDQVEEDIEALKVRRRFLVETMVRERLHEESPLTPEEIDNLWEKTKDRFKAPEEVRASHVFLQVPRGASAGEKETIRKRAEDILEQLRAGMDFAEAARLYSEVPSASKGGDIGYFPRGKFNEAVTEAAFALQVSQISDIVESRHGFHILKCTGRHLERQQTYEEARLDFWKRPGSRAQREKEEQHIAQFIKEAWSNIDTEVHPEVLEDATTGDPSRLVLRVKDECWTVEDFVKAIGVEARIDQLSAQQLKDALGRFSSVVVANAEAERRGWAKENEGIGHELEYKRQRKILRRLRDHWTPPRQEIRVSPEEVEQYYEQLKSQFREPEKKRIRVILCKANMKVTDSPADKKYAQEDALERAQEVIRQYRAGTSFAELARKYSGGFNRNEGGDQGFRGRMSLRPRLRLIYDQPIGEISEPIWSTALSGCFLGVVEEVQPERQKSLDEMRPQILGTLTVEKRNQAFQEQVRQLVDSAQVQIHRENFKNVDFNIALLPITWVE